MKKKIWINILVAALLLAALIIPIPSTAADDGGTREYRALTYKIVKWRKVHAGGVYEETCVYPFPENFKSLDVLWEQEAKKLQQSFVARVIQITGNSALVEPLEGEWERRSSDRIFLSLPTSEMPLPKVGSYIRIVYDGQIMESYPAQIRAQSWEVAHDLRKVTYPEQWLDKQSAELQEYDGLPDLVITEIYADCFIARPVIPMPYTVKLNGQLSDQWCVGDQVLTTQTCVYWDKENGRIEADLVTIETSTFEMEPGVAYKPVLYLYPQQKITVDVKLAPNGGLTCTYPHYEDGWRVTAAPDGTLTDAGGQTYNYLYWEGNVHTDYDLSQGFCIAGEDTAAFLEDALEKLGLNRREANEFIVYWLPLMQENPYNIIAFQTDAYRDAVPLQITPTPDTLIRVFMTWRPVETPVQLQPQILTAPNRVGFTAIEWGGSQLSG